MYHNYNGYFGIITYNYNDLQHDETINKLKIKYIIIESNIVLQCDVDMKQYVY